MGVFGSNRRTGRVLLLLVMIGNVTLIKTQDERRKLTNELYLKVEPRLALEKNRTVEDPSIKKLRKELAILVGPLPEPGLPDHKGIYSIFLQAYHFNVYGTHLWDRGSELYKYWLAWMTDIRKAQWDWNQVHTHLNNCETSINFHENIYSQNESTPKENEDHFKNLTACDTNLNDFTSDALEILEYNLHRSHVRAIHLMAMAMYLTTNLHYESFNGVNFEQTPYKISALHKLDYEYSGINRELKELLKEFESLVGGVDKNSNYGQLMSRAYTNITEKLATSPYSVLYDPNKQFTEERREALRMLEADLYDVYFQFLPDKTHIHLVDEFLFIELGRGLDTFDLRHYKENEEAIEEYFNFTNDTYNKFFRVEPLQPDDSRKDDFVNWDGKWAWEIDGADGRSLIHNMLLGHNILKRVLEEVKCYLNKTYDKKAREQMLEQWNSFDWTKAELYKNRSTTLLKPCTVTNEKDLVGSCTAKNHEICVPIYTHEKQDPESEIAGGLSLVTPSWVYRMENGGCKGKRTYITHFRICQCGFRQDCGSDFEGGVKINCQFVANDYVQRQCRGGPGYPCRTHPLAPGKHQQSCWSGYCDMEENFCEPHHYHIFE